MKEKKQKIYTSLVVGVALFLTTAAILLSTFFNESALKSYALDQLKVANVTTQHADIFWKGFSENDGFKILYKRAADTGVYKEIVPTDIYKDQTYPEGYMYRITLDSLKSSEKYLLEIWTGDLRLIETSFTTKSVKDEIDVPQPISGNSFMFDWVILSTDSENYIINADGNGNWVIDKNLIGEEYEVDIYASTMIKEKNPISSFLIRDIYAAEKANCDEISYSGVPSKIRNKASTFENLLKLNGGPGGNPQYLRCYQDAYCEAEKVGVNGQWTLANWAHESNASDYEYPASTLYEDFGVHCCGVPKKNFQAQLGFYLSLTHDPCNLGSGGTKEQYYCCWANDYLNGSKSTKCTDQTRSYLNGLMAYYYWTSTSADPATFEGRLAGLPSRIKTAAKNVNCGPTDPIEVYENDGKIPGDNDDDQEEGGICCAIKVSGKDDFRGDWEDVSNKKCSQIWEVGREVYGGKIQYSEKISASSRVSCERWWEGTCCNVNGKTEWVTNRNCKKKIPEYTDYNSCIKGETPDEEICCKDTILYEWKYKRKCKNIEEKYDTKYKCERANGREITVNLKLNNGYNFVAWNASDPTDPISALELFDNPEVILVAAFKDGSWNKILYKDKGKIKGPNFNIERANAYLITTTADLSMTYSGRTFTNFEWDGLVGWQFVPAQALDPHSSTKSAVLQFDEADISQVALWDRELGKFNYYVYDLSGNEYGESIRLRDSYGVFVKID